MILRQMRHIGAGELPHLRAEPLVVGFLQTFHAFGLGLGFGINQGRVTPRRVAAAAGFLGKGEGHALVQRTGEERHFAGIRTADHADVLQVNGQVFLNQFQAVNDAAHAPRPGAVLARLAQQFRIQPVVGMVGAGGLTIRRHLVHHVGDFRHTRRESPEVGPAVHADQRGERPASRLRQRNPRSQLDGVRTHRDGHRERVVGVGCSLVFPDGGGLVPIS